MSRDLVAAAFFAVVSGLFAAPVLVDLANWGIFDWDMHLFHQAVPRITLLEYGQFPLWNPYNWSGVPMLANPESRFLAPTFPLTLAFGEVVALKLEILLFLLLGMLGAWKLALEHGASPVAALGAGLLLMLSSWYAVHLAVGHLWALDIALTPWALLFYRRGLSDLRYSLATSGALLWMFFSGGVYPLMMTGLLLVLVSLLSVARERDAWTTHLRLLGLVSAQTAALAAVKLLPTLESLVRYPRLTEAESGFTIGSLVNALVARSQTLPEAWAMRPADFHGTQLHEGMYVGVAGLVVVAIGVLRSFRRHPEWTVLLLVFTWITLGTNVPVSLWAVVHALPGFDNMRVPERFGMVVLLLLSLLFAAGLDGVRDLARRTLNDRRAAAVAAGVGALVAADLFFVDAPILRDAFPIPPLETTREAGFAQATAHPLYGPHGTGRPDRPFVTSGSGLYPALLSNRGSILGYRVVPTPSHAIPAESPKYRGEVSLEETSGKVRIAHWSPNRLRVAVRAEGPGVLVVNQNFDPGWHAADGRPVRARGGRLSVAVTADDREIELFYRPASFLLGAGTTAIAIVLLVFVPRTRGVPRR